MTTQGSKRGWWERLHGPSLWYVWYALTPSSTVLDVEVFHCGIKGTQALAVISNLASSRDAENLYEVF